MQVSEVSNMIEDLGEVSGPTFHAEFLRTCGTLSVKRSATTRIA